MEEDQDEILRELLIANITAQPSVSKTPRFCRLGYSCTNTTRPFDQKRRVSRRDVSETNPTARRLPKPNTSRQRRQRGIGEIHPHQAQPGSEAHHPVRWSPAEAHSAVSSSIGLGSVYLVLRSGWVFGVVT